MSIFFFPFGDENGDGFDTTIVIKWDFLFNFSFPNLKFSVSPYPCNPANYGGDCTSLSSHVLFS